MPMTPQCAARLWALVLYSQLPPGKHLYRLPRLCVSSTELLSHFPSSSSLTAPSSSRSHPWTSHPFLSLFYVYAPSTLYPRHGSTSVSMAPPPSRPPTSLRDNSHRPSYLTVCSASIHTPIAATPIQSLRLLATPRIRSKLLTEVVKALEGLPPALLTASLAPLSSSTPSSVQPQDLCTCCSSSWKAVPWLLLNF